METAPPDIDLTGDFDLAGATDDLPPGVAAGSLGGDDGPPPEEAQPVGVVDPEERPADVPWDGVIRDGSLGGDDGPEAEVDEGDPAAVRGEEALEALEEEEGESPAPGPLAVDDIDLGAPEEPEAEVETPVKTPEPPIDDEVAEPPKPKAPRRPRKKKAAAPTLPASPRKAKSGTVDRLYLIHKMTTAEVDGQVVDVAVRVQFTDPEDESKILPGVRARNRDLALSKASKAFGTGWRGTLVATPEGYWEPEEIFNEPNGGFTPRIGGV